MFIFKDPVEEHDPVQTEDPKDIIILAWNGHEPVFPHFKFDALANFDLILFNYNGTGLVPDVDWPQWYNGLVAKKTEFKGHLINVVAEHVKSRDYRYIAFLDDDQDISVSGINRLLQLAEENDWDVFQPAIAPRSYFSHRRFLQKKGMPPQPVKWVEIMAPFLKKEVFEAGIDFYKGNISSYGFDKYVFPYVQRKLGMEKTFLVHEVSVRHTKRVTKGSKRLSNGLDARQEAELLRNRILDLHYAGDVTFTDTELRDMFEVGVRRWGKMYYDFKRALRFW